MKETDRIQYLKELMLGVTGNPITSSRVYDYQNQDLKIDPDSKEAYFDYDYSGPYDINDKGTERNVYLDDDVTEENYVWDRWKSNENKRKHKWSHFYSSLFHLRYYEDISEKAGENLYFGVLPTPNDKGMLKVVISERIMEDGRIRIVMCREADKSDKRRAKQKRKQLRNSTEEIYITILEGADMGDIWGSCPTDDEDVFNKMLTAADDCIYRGASFTEFQNMFPNYSEDSLLRFYLTVYKYEI